MRPTPEHQLPACAPRTSALSCPPPLASQGAARCGCILGDRCQQAMESGWEAQGSIRPLAAGAGQSGCPFRPVPPARTESQAGPPRPGLRRSGGCCSTLTAHSSSPVCFKQDVGTRNGPGASQCSHLSPQRHPSGWRLLPSRGFCPGNIDRRVSCFASKDHRSLGASASGDPGRSPDPHKHLYRQLLRLVPSYPRGNRGSEQPNLSIKLKPPHSWSLSSHRSRAHEFGLGRPDLCQLTRTSKWPSRDSGP